MLLQKKLIDKYKSFYVEKNKKDKSELPESNQWPFDFCWVYITIYNLQLQSNALPTELSSVTRYIFISFTTTSFNKKIIKIHQQQKTLNLKYFLNKILNTFILLYFYYLFTTLKNFTSLQHIYISLYQ